MSRPLRIEYEGAFYHITARGNERKAIFKGNTDRQDMLNVLKRASNCHRTNIYAYVLMDNHYHLLIETPRANLVKFMHHFQTVYTNRYNSRHKRVGHLFQGRYKSILVEKENYLLELTRYIHLNPVRAGIVKSPEQFHWSSYRCYLGMEESPFLNTDWLLTQFNSRNKRKAILEYKMFVQDGMTNDLESPLKDLFAGFVLGTESFNQYVVEKINNRELSSEIPLQITNSLSPAIRDIKEVVLKEYGITEKELFKRRHNTKALKISLYLARTLTEIPIKTISKELGNRHYSFTSQSVGEIEEEKNKDGRFEEFLKDLEDKIKTNSLLKT